MGDIQIKDLEEITTAPASAFIPIDDGTVTKKISVANFNITGANSAYRSAQSAAANEAGSLSNKNASQEAQTGAVGAQTAAVAAQTAAETAQGYAEAAQTAAQGYATQAINAKDAAARYAAQIANAEAEASDSAERAETAEASARTYANTCSEMAADIASRTNAAESYATTAINKGKDAEAWADGQRDGADVASNDPAYQNNAKYYAQQSATNASSASSSATAAESAKNTAEAKATLATNGATTANTRALDAEAWATGKRNNANVSNSDLAYNNNAKYYAQQASTNATNAAASQVAAESAKTAAINAKNSILASEANAAASASQAQTYAAQAEAATEKMPIVGSNGNWMVYDATEEQYVDSNKPSRGEVGATPVVTGSANVDSGVGTPSVTVVKTGTDAAPNFNFNFHNLKGAKGDTGNPGAAGKGIVSIVKTGTSGLTDTYTITYTDGTTSTFTVRNGADGSGGSGASYTAGNGINIADGAISVDTDSTPTANSSNPIASGWASNFSSSVAATYATKDEVSNIIDGIDYNDGAFVAATGTHKTGYIEKGSGIFRDNSASDTLVLNVAKGEVYKISGRYMYITALYGLYDADGQAVSIYPTGTANTNPAVVENVTIVIPEGVSVLKASTYQTYQKELIVEKWDKTTATTPFSVAVPIGTLYKKKWCVCGDSFTAGDNLDTYVDAQGNVGKKSDAYDKYINHWKTYPWWIAKRNSMSLQWLAISGRAFTNLERLEFPFSNSETPASNYTMIDNDCDYITFMFGLNESNLTDAEIGTKTDTTNATLWGAYNVVLEAILTANPSVKIGIIVSDSWLSQKYHDALIEIAKYWGIPYLDLKNGETVPAMIGPRISDYSPTARALRDGAFKDTTGHPTFESHKYRSTIIENFLRSL